MLFRSRQEQGEGPLAEAGDTADKTLSKQKITGSYYTPRAIVHFMCREALKEHLRTAWHGAAPETADAAMNGTLSRLMETPFPDPPTEQDRDDIRGLVPSAVAPALRSALEELRVVDPAVGSGAFVVGMLHEVVRLRGLLDLHLDGVEKVTRHNHVHDLKKDVIEHSLFGVDIQEQAVRLCELRLWLSLVVDYQLPDGATDHPAEMVRHIPTLPNLSYRVVRGDSLLEWLHGTVVPLQRSLHDAHMIRFFDERRTRDTVRALADAKRAYFQSHNTTQKHQLAAAILDYKASLVERLLATMLQRLDEQTDKGQSFLPEIAAARKERLPIEAERDRLAAILGRVTKARGHLEEHRRMTAVPATASLHALEVEIFGDTARHPAFYWRFDFAEVFEQRDGFDIVIANPPYIRMELIKSIAPHLKESYRSAAGRADAFIYFIEQGVDLLRPTRRAAPAGGTSGGVLAYISSSTFAKTGSGEALRALLGTETTLRRFVDFGDLQVFKGVTTYPAVLVLRKETPPKDAAVRGTVISSLEPDMLEAQLHAPGVIVCQRDLGTDGWRFEDRRLASLRQKIRDAGVPLKEYCGSPLYGIKTGLNKAFVIDTPTRNALVAQDKRSTEVLKRYIEAREIKRWHISWKGLWLIYVSHGLDMSRYPAVLEHLRMYKKHLEGRATSHLHPWYELQQPQERYANLMRMGKLVYPDITARPRFVYDSSGFFVGMTVFFLATEERALQAQLASNVLWWYYAKLSPAIRGGFHRLKTQWMETLPIATPSSADRKKLSALAEALSETECPNRVDLEGELNDRVARLYGLTAEEKKIVDSILPAENGGEGDDGGDDDD